MSGQGGYKMGTLARNGLKGFTPPNLRNDSKSVAFCPHEIIKCQPYPLKDKFALASRQVENASLNIWFQKPLSKRNGFLV